MTAVADLGPRPQGPGAGHGFFLGYYLAIFSNKHSQAQASLSIWHSHSTDLEQNARDASSRVQTSREPRPPPPVTPFPWFRRSPAVPGPPAPAAPRPHRSPARALGCSPGSPARLLQPGAAAPAQRLCSRAPASSPAGLPRSLPRNCCPDSQSPRPADRRLSLPSADLPSQPSSPAAEVLALLPPLIRLWKTLMKQTIDLVRGLLQSWLRHCMTGISEDEKEVGVVVEKLIQRGKTAVLPMAQLLIHVWAPSGPTSKRRHTSIK